MRTNITTTSLLDAVTPWENWLSGASTSHNSVPSRAFIARHAELLMYCPLCSH